MITKAGFMEWLAEIEAELPVTEWTADGVRVWPMIRIGLFATTFQAMLVSYSRAAPRRRQAAVLLAALASYLRATISDHASSVSRTEPADAVFLAYSLGRQPIIGGRCHNPLVAPYVALLERLGCTACVWEWSPHGAYNLPRGTPSAFIQPWLLEARLRGALLREQPERMRLDGFGDFVRRARAAGLPLREDVPERVGAEANYVRRLADRFKRWLERVRPAQTFMADYGPREHALCLASRELGITSVDIQHGVQGPLHPAYGGWTAVPSDGFAMRPRVFWTWDEASAGAIRAWAHRCPTAHAAVVGGDAWHELWRESIDPVAQRVLRDLAEQRRAIGGATHVLVSLDSHGEVLPGPVLTALRSAPAEWCFWFRLHPVGQHERMPVLQAQLAAERLRHADIELATRAPLPALLRSVDVNLTVSWSSVILEAAAFGIPSVACAAPARELYADLVQRGVLRVEEEGPAILTSLVAQAENGRQAVADRPLALDAMREILGMSAYSDGKREAA